jgi:succinate dehydrogenase flavin-adding protein (antitoxin of CptAB toxin-antitoxin module)
MKELDVMLESWLAQCFVAASADEQQQFREMLQLPDPLLASYLLGREQPPAAALRALVEQLRAHRT